MLPHYLVKLFGTRNCRVHEMSNENLHFTGMNISGSNTVCHERLKLSCMIQPIVVEKVRPEDVIII